MMTNDRWSEKLPWAFSSGELKILITHEGKKSLTSSPEKAIGFNAANTFLKGNHVCLIVPWLDIQEKTTLGNKSWFCNEKKNKHGKNWQIKVLCILPYKADKGCSSEN